MSASGGLLRGPIFCQETMKTHSRHPARLGEAQEERLPLLRQSQHRSLQK